MDFIHNESTLKQLKKDEILQVIVGDLFALGVYIRIASKRELIRIVNSLDDLLMKVAE